MSLQVVLDTNVLVSALLYPGSTPGKIIAVWKAGLVDIILSPYILDEAIRVIPKLSKARVTPDEALIGLEEMRYEMNLVEPVSLVEPDLKDPYDLPILGTLVASKADYLITGDKALLALAGKYPVVTPAEFWMKHG